MICGCNPSDPKEASKANVKKPIQGDKEQTHPNIVIIITDDQGYGDLGCTGNPRIKTPHTDKLARESIWLTDYHVAPTCSPTRAALMSGHWTNRTGVWHTIMGRSMLRTNEGTLGQFFNDNGYETGMFGKWHLGDNYPYRPEDRGFTEVYRHGGGGVGQTPDVWDNAYFDGGYFHNGKIVKAKGFCTDVFLKKVTVLSVKAWPKKNLSLPTFLRMHLMDRCILLKNILICIPRKVIGLLPSMA